MNLLLRLNIIIFFSLISVTAYAQPQENAPKATQASEKGEQADKSESGNKPTITAPVNKIVQNQQDLKHFLGKQNIQPMLAGANDFLTLVTPNTSANEKGVVILLPDWHHTSTDPKALNHLRKSLPNQGWTTISLEPMPRPKNYPSRAEKAIAQQEENKASLTTYQQELSKILTVVMEKAQAYPGIIMMISQGNNGAQLQQYLTDKQSQKEPIPNALILLSAFMPTELENNLFAKQIAESSIATLDLLLSRDHPKVLYSAEQRKLLAKKEMKAIYRQKQLPNLLTGYYPEQDLLKQINGWLRAIGW